MAADSYAKALLFFFLLLSLYGTPKKLEVEAFCHICGWRSTRSAIASCLCAKDTSPHHDGRDVASLQEWAQASGVLFADGVSLEPSETKNDWGVLLKEPARAGTTVMSVPTNLVLSSLAQEEFLEPAIATLDGGGMKEYRPEFLLIIRLLMEHYKGTSSSWYPWLYSLPIEFNTGVYMDKVERTYLKIFASEFMAAQDKQLEVFTRAIQQVRLYGDAVFLRNLSNDVIRWAYSVVFTRSWRSPSGKDDKAYLVPLGDMFNHREPANVIIDEVADSIKVLLKENVDSNSGLYLSYGITQHTARFLVIFGFYDEQCHEVFANITFPNISVREKNMGFVDWSKMVFRTLDGAISNTVWDAVLWKILATNPSEQLALYNAHMTDDVVTKATMHSRYGLEMALELRKYVQDTLDNTYPEKLTETNFSANDFVQHPRLKLIVRYNTWMRKVMQRVKDQVDEAVKVAETEW